LGDVVDHDETTMLVRDPLQINYKFLSFQPMPAISVSRYMPFAEDTSFVFELQNILHAVEPKQVVIDYYHYALKNYQDNIDGMVDTELAAAAEKPAKQKSKTQTDELYKMLLERAENDGPLN
jgi:hypothetical protein